jgi:uncharacterized protein (DUF2237 family)
MANDVGAADDHGMLAAQVLHADGLQHLHAAIGRAGLEADFAHHQRARAGHMETVHVLERRDGLDDLVVVDVGGQRQLDQDAVDAGVVVQRLDAGQQFGLGLSPTRTTARPGVVPRALRAVARWATSARSWRERALPSMSWAVIAVDTKIKMLLGLVGQALAAL